MCLSIPAIIIIYYNNIALEQVYRGVIYPLYKDDHKADAYLVELQKISSPIYTRRSSDDQLD